MKGFPVNKIKKNVWNFHSGNLRGQKRFDDSLHHLQDKSRFRCAGFVFVESDELNLILAGFAPSQINKTPHTEIKGYREDNEETSSSSYNIYWCSSDSILEYICICWKWALEFLFSFFSGWWLKILDLEFSRIWTTSRHRFRTSPPPPPPREISVNSARTTSCMASKHDNVRNVLQYPRICSGWTFYLYTDVKLQAVTAINTYTRIVHHCQATIYLQHKHLKLELYELISDGERILMHIYFVFV